MTVRTQPRQTDGWTLRRLLLLCALIFALLYLGWWLVVILAAGLPKSLQDLGSLGDTFGVINALFSGLALLLVALTLWQAQQQLRIQQKELSQNTQALHAQRDELEAQRKELHAQTEYLGRAAIRDQFFQLLDSWQDVARDIRRGIQSAEVAHGVRGSNDGFAEAAAHIASSVKQTPPSRNEISSDTLRHLASAFEEFEADRASWLGHYFRLLYQILLFVDRHTVIAADEKYAYVRMVRAHLSQSELYLLFFNGISRLGSQCYPLIEKYRVLSHLDFLQLPQWAQEYVYPESYNQRKAAALNTSGWFEELSADCNDAARRPGEERKDP